jgi:hypothetical protein
MEVVVEYIHYTVPAMYVALPGRSFSPPDNDRPPASAVVS